MKTSLPGATLRTPLSSCKWPALFCALSVILGSSLCFAVPLDPCAQIAEDASLACQASVERDYQIALGKCDNISDPTAQASCERQARTDRADAVQTCHEQDNLRKGTCARTGRGTYEPVIDPANFVTTIDNPFFPLPPGTTFVYEGQTSEGFERVEFAVTHNTKVILDVTCEEVHDSRFLDGVLTEDTRDWFAQDKTGNVWYFGENTAVLENGLPVDFRILDRRG